jgi:uncharacterized OsmC-like protein
VPKGPQAVHSFEVSAEYLRREQIVIDLPSGIVIADHPVALGGDGRGPSAAELVLLALTSSAVLSPLDLIANEGTSRPKFASRATFQSARQRIDGPMVSLGRMAHVHHRLDAVINSSFSDSAMLFKAASDCAVAVALQNGISITDAVEFVLDDTPREALPFVNETRRDRENNYRSSLQVGETMVTKPESSWRVIAESLPPRSAVLSLASEHFLASSPALDEPLGPRPNEYLAAALAACTVFFIVHQCGFHDIPVGSVRCQLKATEDDNGVLRSIESKATVKSNLTPAEIKDIEFVASHCFIGETFRAGVPVTFEYGTAPAISGNDEGTTITGGTGDISCDDGSCCIPDLATP